MKRSLKGNKISLFSLVALLGIGAYWLRTGSHSEVVENFQGQRVPSSTRPIYPWEISGPQGEMVLPDLLYAESAQNEQVMPTRLRLEGSQGGEVDYQIDRLIYPTLGNPKLYFKGDAEDAFLVVVRIEKEFLEKITYQIEAIKDSLFSVLRTAPVEKNGFSFYLIRREGRPVLEGSQIAVPSSFVLPVTPTRIEIHTGEGLPDEFNYRKTLKFYFDQKTMAQIAPDLYDLRFEAKQEGRLKYHEFQYNAVKVFEGVPSLDKYYAVNITDTQTSISSITQKILSNLSFKELTLDKFVGFVDFVNEAADEKIKNAAFITFAGDLHNGGSPVTLLTEQVATTYNSEAKVIVENLRKLRLPIFLTPGNHDGYASTGHVPSMIEGIEDDEGGRKDLKEVIQEHRPDYDWVEFERFLEATQDFPGGRHLDLFQGKYIRHFLHKSGKDWIEVPKEQRNIVLYDGFNQWKKTYGPLYYSWVYGRNHYISLNTYDLRQHRRTGWGMYTVNYGGNISPFQMAWLEREVANAEESKRDITMFAHHDPRGGHNGKDFPYYFRQIDYQGMSDSIVIYVKGEYLNPKLCAAIPKWAKSKNRSLDCLHDGLEEWMRSDPEFDCWLDQMVEKDGKKICDFTLKTAGKTVKKARHPVYSGYEFIDLLAKKVSIRTLILGHTHYNSIAILQPDDFLIPDRVVLDKITSDRLSELETVNPNRTRNLGNSTDRAPSFSKGRNSSKKPEATSKSGIFKDIDGYYKLDFEQSGHRFKRKLMGHELAVIRLTSASKITSQVLSLNSKPMYGFSVLEISVQKDDRNYPIAQVNRVYFYQRDDDASQFIEVGKSDLDRTASWLPEELRSKKIKLMFTPFLSNPLADLFHFE